MFLLNCVFHTGDCFSFSIEFWKLRCEPKMDQARTEDCWVENKQSPAASSSSISENSGSTNFKSPEISSPITSSPSNQYWPHLFMLRIVEAFSLLWYNVFFGTLPQALNYIGAHTMLHACELWYIYFYSTPKLRWFPEMNLNLRMNIWGALI